MRTLKQLIKASKIISMRGSFFDMTKFEDAPGVILPEMTGDEEDKYFDDLIEHWYDQDYWFCFDHDEKVEGYISEPFQYEVIEYKEVKP